MTTCCDIMGHGAQRGSKKHLGNAVVQRVAEFLMRMPVGWGEGGGDRRCMEHSPTGFMPCTKLIDLGQTIS